MYLRARLPACPVGILVQSFHCSAVRVPRCLRQVTQWWCVVLFIWRVGEAWLFPVGCRLVEQDFGTVSRHSVSCHRPLSHVTMRRGHGHGMKRLVTHESEADKAARKAIGMKQLWMYVRCSGAAGSLRAAFSSPAAAAACGTWRGGAGTLPPTPPPAHANI